MKKLKGWFAGLDEEARYRVKVIAIILGALILLSVLSGCATNQAALITACANAPTVLVSERYDSGGKPERVYKQSCDPRTLPQDKTMGYVMQGVAIIGKTVLGIEAAHALRDFGTAAVTNSGHNTTIGGDGVIGNENTAFDPISIDMTTPPTIVTQPPPVIVDPTIVEVPPLP